MQIQVNANNSVQLSERMNLWVADETQKSLDRFSRKITRVEVYFNDVNSDKGGERDKYCTVETRFTGLPPMATHHQAASLDLALAGALDKLEKVLSRSLDKIDHKKGRTPFGGEPFAELAEPMPSPDL